MSLMTVRINQRFEKHVSISLVISDVQSRSRSKCSAVAFDLFVCLPKLRSFVKQLTPRELHNDMKHLLISCWSL